MKSKHGNNILSVTLPIAIMALIVGCDQTETTIDSAEYKAPGEQPAGDQKPLGHVVESDDFTLRANVNRADLLPDSMAEKYGIEPETDLFLLNLVIQEHRPDQQPLSVSADVSATHESLTGHSNTIDMRSVEEDGYVSYIGTLDASNQRFFILVIEAHPEGTDQPLQMHFEVQLDAFEDNDAR